MIAALTFLVGFWLGTIASLLILSALWNRSEATEPRASREFASRTIRKPIRPHRTGDIA